MRRGERGTGEERGDQRRRQGERKVGRGEGWREDKKVKEEGERGEEEQRGEDME